jgi:hypothetical protein
MFPSADDYDTPWKEAVSQYFPEFMAFYFPDAHAGIDWNQPYIFLDKELAHVVQDAELGKRLADRLVQVAPLRKASATRPRGAPRNGVWRAGCISEIGTNNVMLADVGLRLHAAHALPRP